MWLGRQGRAFQSKLPSQNSQISELWVQLRDPTSVNRTESNRERLHKSNSGLYIHMHTHVSTLTYQCKASTSTHVHMSAYNVYSHTYIYTYPGKKE